MRFVLVGLVLILFILVLFHPIKADVNETNITYCPTKIIYLVTQKSETSEYKMIDYEDYINNFI
jgi:hypothetical protein